MLEGACSLGLLAFELVRSPSTSGAGTIVQHDSKTGWTNMPDLELRGIYGPGTEVTTNRLGFRMPAGSGDSRQTVVFSGDSFTFGHGVCDAETWPAVIAKESSINALNLGVNGYGLDQMALRYLQHKDSIEHQVHVVSIIVDSFERMRYDSFSGLERPRVRVVDNRLDVENEPIPRASSFVRWMSKRQKSIAKIGAVRLAARFTESTDARPQLSLDKAFRLGLRLIDELRQITEQAGRKLIVVLLPVEGDCVSDVSDGARTILARALQSSGTRVVDLVAEFRRVPPTSIAGLYLHGGEAKAVGTDGHFSEAGNRLVAKHVLKAIHECLGN